jgi:hypothetical protein
VLCVHVFYFALRNHSEFKFELESKEFENLKRSVKKEKVFSFGLSLGVKPIASLADLSALSLARSPASVAFGPTTTQPPELPCAGAMLHCTDQTILVSWARVTLGPSRFPPPPPKMVSFCNDLGFDPLRKILMKSMIQASSRDRTG